MKRQRTAHGKAPRRAPASTPAPASTGVNKVKNAIRQTKRLLARDTITPGTRIEAERRLLALQRELEEKEKAGKERNLASRYHKVKFFERQKIHRRVRQLRREAEKDPKKKAVRAALYEARVLLHYVMRYVALFAQGNHDPVLPKSDASDRAQQKAAAYLAHVRKQVKRGELSDEPEVELEAREEASRQARRTSGTKRTRVDDASNAQAPKRRNVAQEADEESEASDASDASSSGDSDSDRDRDTSDGGEAENAAQGSETPGTSSSADASDEVTSSDESSSEESSSEESSSEESSSEEEAVAPRNERGTRKPAAPAAPSKPSLADDEFFAM